MKTQFVPFMLLVYALAFSGGIAADSLNSGNAAVPASDRNRLIIASLSTDGSVCGAPVPVLFDAASGDGQITLTWSNEHAGNPSVTGYNVYYDRGGKSEPITSVWRQTGHILAGLSNSQEYCIKVTSLYAECESGFSNVICTVPVGQEQQK